MPLDQVLEMAKEGFILEVDVLYFVVMFVRKSARLDTADAKDFLSRLSKRYTTSANAAVSLVLHAIQQLNHELYSFLCYI